MKKYITISILSMFLVVVNIITTTIIIQKNTYIGFSDATKSYGFITDIEEIKIITPGRPSQVVFNDEDLINTFIFIFDDLTVREHSFDSGTMSQYRIIVTTARDFTYNFEMVNSSLKVEKGIDIDRNYEFQTNKSLHNIIERLYYEAEKRHGSTLL